MSGGAVLITGGAARIGAHIARGLAADGWEVCLHYNRSKSAADRLCHEIISAGGAAVSIGGNLAIRQDVGRLITRSAAALGRPLTALINNASTFSPDTAQSHNNALFDYHMDINLRAPLMLSRDFAAQCPQDVTGVIINMIDQRVLKPNPTYFTYTAAKTALYHSTKTLAQALAPHIRVNGIGPGPSLQNTDQSAEMFLSEVQNTLLKRGSPPEEILAGIRYLLNAMSVTGQMIAIDGGQHLTWQTADILAATPKGAI
jgi:NAD(P)-dependent dehydrogenase (short-subunit alcohol dehydrogenase family)